MKRQLPRAARATERRSNPRGTEETAVDPHVRIRLIQTQLHFAKGGVKMSMPLSALPLVVPGLDKHVVRDGIPGVVNADEEQQQHRRCDAQQSLAQMGAGTICR